MTPKEYQPILKTKLKKIYKHEEVEIEWLPMKGNRNIYSPRVDAAVGPFALDHKFQSEYDSLMQTSRIFIEKLIKKYNENLRSFDLNIEENLFNELKYFNQNARCLLCIEIENKVSRKHLIGGLVNASALGRIGILIPWTSEKLKAFINLRNYLEFLGSVGKNTFKTNNIIILTKEQLDDCF